LTSHRIRNNSQEIEKKPFREKRRREESQKPEQKRVHPTAATRSPVTGFIAFSLPSQFEAKGEGPNKESRTGGKHR